MRREARAVALAVAFAASPAFAQTRLDAAFVDRLAQGARRHPFADASGRLAVTIELPPFADARSMGFLPVARGLGTRRMTPGELARFELEHPELAFSIWPPLRPVLDESAKLNGTLAYREALRASGSPIAGTGKGVVVGVVDSGLDVTLADFRDALGHSRVAWLIDFSHLPIGRHPELENQFGCTDPMQTPCAVLDQADIDVAIAGGPGAYLPHDLLGHGTHVASIAAGNGGADARFVGGAPEATLVVANVSQGPAGDSADADIVTGMSFVFDRAAALGLPAVANLSLGSDFGPHDGSTPLEKALSEMVGSAHPGRAIVVAAGNSGTLYVGNRPEQRFGVHTQTRVTDGVDARTNLLGLAGVTLDAELSGSASVWLTFGPTDAVAVGLDGPGGLSIAPVAHGKQASAATSDNALRAAIYNGVVDPSVSLTADSRGAIVVWDGTWPDGAPMTLRFEGEGFVDAWVETRPDGSTGPFNEFFELATREGTINVPATAPDLIAVGCTVNRTAWTDADARFHDVTMPATLNSHDSALLAPADSTCFFSSVGPTATGAAKPEISAPGGIVVAAMSSDSVPGLGSIFDAPSGACPDGNACLVVDPTHAILSGSSMSAPQVAGAVALLFERDATLTQADVLVLLQAGARRPTGNVGSDYQLGAGALAVDGAIAALESRNAPIAREPDAARSWMTLSAGTARPDGRAVQGTVEVRAADGAIADGFDVARLTLDVGPEGTIARPLTRVAPGLFRFDVRALPGTGSRTMDIDVRLDGVPLGERASRLSGHRSLPIGADRWIALGSPRAYGGCSFSSGRPTRTFPSRLLLLLALLGRKSPGPPGAPRAPGIENQKSWRAWRPWR
jgi:subtilisin family serine protease